MGTGSSFGEIALLYDAKRQATVRSLSPCVLHSLDRATFQYSIATASASAMSEMENRLRANRLFETFTDDQITKLCDAVKVVSFEAGAQIITKGEIGTSFYIVKSGVCVGSGMVYIVYYSRI